MPLCMRDSYESDQKKSADDKTEEASFHDNEEVFYCETTRKIFRDYEEYFRHVMLINSTIWICEATGREHLTYAEALKSERRTRKKLEGFKEALRAPIMFVIEKAQQSSYRELCNLCYQFLKDRYFFNEEVQAVHKTKQYLAYKVVSIIKPQPTPPDGVYDPSKVSYKLKKLDGKHEVIDVAFEHIRRGRSELVRESLLLFIKEHVKRVEGILKPKPESYKKFVTDLGLNFSKVFIGELPAYRASKSAKDKKQAPMSKYLVKNKDGPSEEEKRKKENSLREEMERVRKEKEAKLEEMKQKQLELVAKIEEEANQLLKKTDDLERRDQRLMPVYRPIKTVIPNKYLGDCLMLQEFLHSFVAILSGYAVFKNNINFYEVSRAFTEREIVGPLSDILLVLLGTIFDLQHEEEEECSVDYVRPKITDREPYKTIGQATKTHEYVRTHFSFKMNELPMDAHTLSEVLRLHFLGSGAQAGEKAERWRAMYRNGYYSTEDPGLCFRMQVPHILRALKMYTVYQLPTADIIKIIQCLISQILTYSSSIGIIEERMETLLKSKQELRALLAAENKRASSVVNKKKTLNVDYAQQCLEEAVKNDETKKKALETNLNKQVAEVMALSDRDKKKFDTQLTKIQNNIFDYMVYLGMDRAYRKYYIFEAIPGIFIEHPIECYDVCLQDPPQNWEELVDVPHNKKDLRTFLSKLYNMDKSVSKPKHVVDKEANKENQQIVNGKLNGEQDPLAAQNGLVAKVNGEAEAPAKIDPPTQYELLMCTGNPKQCFVHDERNPDRVRWAYICTEAELDALIESLNPLGERESHLREQLTSLRLLIINHIRTCPVDFLSLDEDSMRLARFKSQMKIETNKKYKNPNYPLGEGADLSEAMHAALLDRILQFERDITTGCLGKMKVKNLEKWLKDLHNNTYDSQVPLNYGPEHPKLETDPGEGLGDTLDIESEDSADDEISLHDSPEIRNNVRNLASALLQIEQSIEQKFLKEPFGIQKETKDKEKMEQMLEKGRERIKHWEVSLMNSTSYSQVFLHLNILNDTVKWQRSTNKSNCQICHRRSDPEKMLLCDECNAGTHMYCMEPKMKTVPEGNWYCKRCVDKLGYKNGNQQVEKRPKRKRAFKLLDDEDNRSESSASGTTRSSRGSRKRLLSEEIEQQLNDQGESEVEDGEEEMEEIQEEEEQQEVDDENEMEQEDDESEDVDETIAEDDEETDEDVCIVCSYDGGEISCFACKSVYHLDCAELKRAPRSNWSCSKCKVKEERKRKSTRKNSTSDEDDDDDNDEPAAKRNRQSASKRASNHSHSTRSSLVAERDSRRDSSSKSTNNNNRRSRRTGDNLPLNSVALYELLDDIMKNKSAWPFLRPVSSAEVPDYYDIIERPMDFAKIKSKLNMGQYTINEEVLKDVQLIFKNCDRYNAQGDEIYKAGVTLEKFIIKKCKELGLPFIPSDMNAS